jgi:ribosomal protein L27
VAPLIYAKDRIMGNPYDPLLFRRRSTKIATGTGLGTGVMASMTASLSGTIEFAGDASGTRAILRFPVRANLATS